MQGFKFSELRFDVNATEMFQKLQKPSQCPECKKFFKINIEALHVGDLTTGKSGWLCPHCKQVVEVN